jgi:hypothetical protein
MSGIEKGVDGGGGDGRWRRNGRHGRASAAGQGDGGSPSSLVVVDVNQRVNGNSTYYRNS